MVNGLKKQISSSFRDPSGFVFFENDILYRQVNKSYQREYDLLTKSGLYKTLVEKKLLIQHEVVKPAEMLLQDNNAYCIVRPEPIRFISYPYEWSFLQLKDAALATLTIMRESLEKNMILKDASAYNLQFHKGSWVLIDTLSFEAYQEGLPWIAYRQFCQHFLVPLALMAYADYKMGLLSRLFIDGVPLDMASKLLPAKTKWKFGLLTHIHIHANSQKNTPTRKLTSRILRGDLVGFL